MAIITFFDATTIDEYQLTDGLRETDHYWEFVPEHISVHNLNPEAEVISVFVGSVVTREVIDRLPKLKLIAARSTGFDHIDTDYAAERGIAVVTVPTYGENTVAEHAFALLLAVGRKLLPTVATTRAGNFVASKVTGIDLKGRTMGIIGLGHIGEHAAKIARGFEMDVVVYDIHPRQELVEQLGIRYASLDEVLGQSDVVSLHTPLTPDNYHLINTHSIEKMKPGAILINTARGELVENRALILALKSKHLGGAGLDTIEGEAFLTTDEMIDIISGHATAPSSYEHVTEVQALLNMPNVVITQHAAFNTVEAIERINRTTAENIIKFWYGEIPNRVQNRSSLGKLVLVRHTESEWNALGKWTGVTDVHLSSKGHHDAVAFGKVLADIPFAYAYTSEQMRSRETLEAIINSAGQVALEHEPARALNERDYGVYTGMNKEQIRGTIGDEAYNELRRSYTSPVEGGESLEQVYQRVVPFYLRVILPRLRHGQNILVVAHGNSIRALIKYLEDVSDEDIGTLEMIQNQALIYDVDQEGRSTHKSTRELS